MKKVGILLVNLGTPDAPSTAAVRRYLAQFLGDSRVIEFKPRWLWRCILHGIILRTRPSRSAKAYRSVWVQSQAQAEQLAADYLHLGSVDDEMVQKLKGSPLLTVSRLQAEKLQEQLPENYHVALGMCYGKPSIIDGLLELRHAKVDGVVVLPLYPQYSSTTVAPIFDQVTAAFKHCRVVPPIRFIHEYHAHPKYINALTASVKKAWQTRKQPDVLLMSFHGLPQTYVDKGDPYQQQCLQTAALLAKALKLKDHQWQVSFQSRVGRMPWLQPYTDDTLKALGKAGQSVDVICPGFAADCLETIEEISDENREYYETAGGDIFHYIPALNIHRDHIAMLANLLVV